MNRCADRAGHTSEQLRDNAMSALTRIAKADGPESRAEVLGQIEVVKLSLNALYERATKPGALAEGVTP